MMSLVPEKEVVEAWVIEETEGGAVTEETEGGAVTEETEGGAVTEETEGGVVTEETEGGTVTEATEEEAVIEETGVGGATVDPLFFHFIFHFQFCFTTRILKFYTKFSKLTKNYYVQYVVGPSFSHFISINNFLWTF